MGNFAATMPRAAIQQAASQLPQAAQPTQPAAQTGKAGQAMPSPQALGQGLQQQQMLQAALQSGKGGQRTPSAQIPMSMQRQPQGGMAGRTPQIGNAARSALGSFRGY